MTDVLWSRPDEERHGTPLLLMLHGYGSDERDMGALFGRMPRGMTCAAPRGPRAIAKQHGWFLLDYFLNNDFAEVVGAASTLLAWLDTVTARYHFSSVSVLGFSQGMAMATTLLRLRPDAFALGVGLSGFVVANELLAATEPLPTPRPFYWGRDTVDLVIHPDAVTFTQGWLARNTELTEAHYAGMGHRVGPDAARDVSAFLSARVPGAFVPAP